MCTFVIGQRVRVSWTDTILARNLSIWLLPGADSTEYQRLGEIINYLAEKNGNTPFPPHVTLSMLPADFPLEIVRDVVEEVKEEWFSRRIEFESLFTTAVGIVVHGQRGNQAGASMDSGSGHDHIVASTISLQQRFHDRLQEEVQKRRLTGTLAADTPDVRNIVPWFPHLSLAYTERGQEEGVREIAEKGWFTQSKPGEALGIELAGLKGYKIGAIYFAYCGGLKPEKWQIFERIEETQRQTVAT